MKVLRRFLYLAGATTILSALAYAACAQAPAKQAVAVTFSLPLESLPQIQASLRDGTLEVIARERPGGRDLAVGQIVVIDNVVDPANRTVRIKAAFGTTHGILPAGQLVDVRLLDYTAVGEVLP